MAAFMHLLVASNSSQSILLIIKFPKMKSLFVYLATFFMYVSSLIAQTTYDTIASPFNTIVHAFGELDPQYMPNGMLLHAVVPLEQPLRFGGHFDRHDQTTLTPGRFGALAMTVQSAVIDLDQPNLFDTTYVKYYEETSDDEIVHYAGLHVEGGVFHDDALDLNQIAVSVDSTQFIHGPNISSAAYVADTVFAFCPLTKTFPAGTVTHVFLSSNFYGNLPWGLPLEFDPGDGLGFRNIQLGDSLEIDYVGLDTALLELRYSNNGHTYRAYSKVAVSPPQRPASGAGDPCVFTEVEGVSIEVAFADPDCESTHFANSLIVVDGIDPTSIQNVTFDIAFEKYEFSVSNTPIQEIIAARGYDFIFINFDDGGQSVEATAQILKNSIRWING